MRTGSLVFFLLLLFAGAVWVGFAAGDRAARKAPREVVSPAGESAPAKVPLWAGSDSCAQCHPGIAKRFQKTGHANATHRFPEGLLKPFDGDIFAARGIDQHLGPGPFMECEGPRGTLRRFPVERVVGTRRIQMYLTPMDRGRIQVLPVFLEIPKKRWFDYTDFIFGFPPRGTVPPDSAYSWYGPHRNWNSRCGRCHVTHFEIHYDPDEGRYRSTDSEKIIGCEACHGPGGKHIEKWQDLAPGPDPIVNPARMPLQRANEVCGLCHTESYMVDPRFKLGDDLFAAFEVAGLENAKHAFPDGRAKELFHNLIPIMESRCGPLSCTRCHDPHGSGIPGDVYRPVSDDSICTGCHGSIGEDLTAHTHHKGSSPGSRCIACHMPRLVIEGGHGKVYDHTISIPSIRNTKLYGLPNACRTCHLDRYPGWEYESFQKWYPEAEKHNHRVPLAAAITAARENRSEAKKLLRALVQDANPAYRAAAAHYLAHHPEVDLRPLLSDPSLYVRRAAVDNVAAGHPEALEPLLESGNLVLARAAAVALAGKSIVQSYDYITAAPAALRAKVRLVLEQCVALRPDDADLHYLLAAIYAIDQEPEASARALRRYRLLRPWTAPRGK